MLHKGIIFHYDDFETIHNDWVLRSEYDSVFYYSAR